MGLEGLPSQRTSLQGATGEGEPVELVRAISRKLYRCPLCRGEIAIGDEHVIVRYPRREEAHRTHQHWHRRCVEDGLLDGLQAVRRVPAGRR